MTDEKKRDGSDSLDGMVGQEKLTQMLIGLIERERDGVLIEREDGSCYFVYPDYSEQKKGLMKMIESNENVQPRLD